jgi:hypothetical protein
MRLILLEQRARHPQRRKRHRWQVKNNALFEIERDINGLSAEERLRVRQEQSVAPCGGVAA